MKLSWKLLVLIAILAFASSFVVSCRTYSTSDPTDNQSLEKLLTKEYDLSELETYIKIGNTNRASYPAKDLNNENIIFYQDLDSRYPVEVFRICDEPKAAYSVYKVLQGGYYYVFWSFAYPMNELDEGTPFDWSDTEHMCVYFSTYIDESRSIFRFLSIRFDISTAADVLALDPDSEYVDTSSRRSYCFLNKKYVLEIKYKAEEHFRDTPDFKYLVVESMRIVPRENTTACIGRIFQSDLPNM